MYLVLYTHYSETGVRVEFVDGKMTVIQSSLVVGGQESGLAEGEYEEIEEGVHASSRYSSFLNRKKPARWGLEETRLFYSAVQQCGTEFSLMQTFFPHRTRKELKHKFRREEKHHPELVMHATKSNVPLGKNKYTVLSSVCLT